MDYDFNLTVWQTKDCVRCGGCCYVCVVDSKQFLKLNNTLCDKLAIDSSANNTSCSLYGTTIYPEPCLRYFCLGKEKPVPETEIYERLLIVRIVLDYFKIKPVANTEEIRRTLEKMQVKKI